MFPPWPGKNLGVIGPNAPATSAIMSISQRSSSVALAELAARFRQASEIILLGDFLVNFVPWVLQFDVRVPHEQ